MLKYKGFEDDPMGLSSSFTECIRQTGLLDADFVVNATGYQSLTPNLTVEARPLGFDVVYQACIAFRYEDTAPGEGPLSFIVMDGWFPCLMPNIDDGPVACDQQPRENGYSKGQPHSAEAGSISRLSSPSRRHYILTHGSYTILGSFPRPEQAQHLLDCVFSPSPSSSPSSPPCESAFTNASHPISQLRTAAETEICRFWPLFRGRFQYRGCQGSVLAKLRTECEFRSSFVFAQDRIIYVFPGKISNVFRACDDVVSLIAAEASIGARVKGKGNGEGNKDGRRGSEGSGDCRRENMEEGVVVVDGYSIVKSTLAEVNHAHSRQGGGEAAAVSGGHIDAGINNDVQAAEESKGRSTCDLQTYDTLLKREMRG